jgi:hypothetical protein
LSSRTEEGLQAELTEDFAEIDEEAVDDLVEPGPALAELVEDFAELK